jgi:hypothetical protein
MENLVQRTLIEYDTFDPVKNLWRNVLVTAIEDAIKLKNRTIEFKKFYKGKTYYEIEYVTKPNRDFDGVCYLANLDGNIVRRKINKVMKDMEDNYGKDNMPKMPWKRLYKSNGFNGESASDRNYIPMSTM